MLYFCATAADNIDDDDNTKNTEPVNNEENIYMNTECTQNKTIEITKDNILSYVKKKKTEDLPFAEEFLVCYNYISYTSITFYLYILSKLIFPSTYLSLFLCICIKLISYYSLPSVYS